MHFFTSLREKYLWLSVLAVLIAIFSTLFSDQPIQRYLSEVMEAQAFLFAMIMVGAIILIYAVRKKFKSLDLVIGLGILAVYILLFLRLGLPERSHLLEYGVLAVLIHLALIERLKKSGRPLKAALIALALTISIGILDECIQIFLPYRVFDPIDILFNCLAVVLAIGTRLLFQWVQKKELRINN